MKIADTPEWTIEQAIELAAFTRPIGDGSQSLATFLRRRVARVSAAKMAQVLGIHPETLRSWERGKFVPHGANAENYLSLLKQIEAQFQVTHKVTTAEQRRSQNRDRRSRTKSSSDPITRGSQ